MDNHGFPRHQLDDWMCLVSLESGYEQTARNPDNVDGSTDWGLFVTGAKTVSSKLK